MIRWSQSYDASWKYDSFYLQTNVLAFLLDVPPVMMGDIIFLVKWIEIMNQCKVSRAGVICLPEEFYIFCDCIQGLPLVGSWWFLGFRWGVPLCLFWCCWEGWLDDSCRGNDDSVPYNFCTKVSENAQWVSPENSWLFFWLNIM